MEAAPPQGAITLAQALDRAVAFHRAGRRRPSLHHRRALALRPEEGATNLALALLHGRIGEEPQAVAWLRQGVTETSDEHKTRSVKPGP